MSNSPEVLKALDEVANYLLSLSDEEFKMLMNEEQEKMDKSIINGHDHLGLTLWYAQDPEAVDNYIKELLISNFYKTHGNGD